MKKWLLWIALTTGIAFLISQLIREHVAGVKSERQWYIENLHFEFSGIVDTTNRPGHILFHVSHGKLDHHKEIRLNEQLKRNGILDLFIYMPEDQMELMIPKAHLFARGDSIYINSNQNKVKVYRKKKLLLEYPLIQLLRGRPF